MEANQSGNIMLELEQHTQRHNSLLPLDECNTRLDFAETLERLIREEAPGWQFNPETLAAFLMIPLYKIESLLRGNNIVGADILRCSVEVLADATRYFLQLSQDILCSATATPQHDAAQLSQQGSPLGPRAPIIPFDETQRSRSGCLTQDVCSLFDIHTTAARFFYNILGAGDKEWNTVPISPELRDAWGGAYFGLRVGGTLPAEESQGDDTVVSVQLQYVWMPRKKSSRDDTGQPIPLKSLSVDLASERRAFEQARIRGERDGELETASTVFHATSIGTRFVDAPSTTEIDSGQVFEVKMRSSSVERFTVGLQIHRVLVSMAAISGAADAVEHGWREPPPGDEVTEDELMEEEEQEEGEEGENDETALTCPRCRYQIPRHTIQ